MNIISTKNSLRMSLKRKRTTTALNNHNKKANLRGRKVFDFQSYYIILFKFPICNNKLKGIQIGKYFQFKQTTR